MITLILNLSKGAANVLRLAKNLNHVAHSLHNLLAVHGMDKIDSIKQIISKCKEVVTPLHFK